MVLPVLCVLYIFKANYVCRLHIPGSGAAKRLLDFLLMQKSDVNLVSASSAAATGRKEESRDGEINDQLNSFNTDYLSFFCYTTLLPFF